MEDKNTIKLQGVPGRFTGTAVKVEAKEILGEAAYLTEITQKDFELIKQYKDLKGLDFSNSYFNGVRFDSEIENCNFVNSKFYDCRFATTNIKECDFTNCDMDLDFSITTVQNCNFTNARLEGSAYYTKFLNNDFTDSKLQRFRMRGQSELKRNVLKGTELDAVFWGQNVAVSENHFVDSVKAGLSSTPELAVEYKEQQLKALHGEKFEYGEKLKLLSNTMAEQRENRYLKEFAEQHKKAMASLQETKKTVVINAFAGAGAGKTTACHMIVAELKKRGYVAEYVSEYAKDLVWDNKLEVLDGKEYNQFEILKAQLHRMDNKMGKVDFLVTDSPVLLNQIYNKEFTDYYKEMLVSIHSDYRNFNFFINRNPQEFQQEGRIHNLAESMDKDQEIKNMLSEYGLEYQEYTHETIEDVVEKIVSETQSASVGKEKKVMDGEIKKFHGKDLDQYIEPGFVIEDDEYQYFIERFSIKELTDDYFQMADEAVAISPVSGELEPIHPLNPSTQKAEPVYHTFVTDAQGIHKYVGYCFAGDRIQYGEKFHQWKMEQLHQQGENRKVQETEQKMPEEVKTMESGEEFAEEKWDMNTTWEHIEEQWDYLEKHAEEYTPESYEIAKMRIEEDEMFLEEQEQVFIESIEEVRVSERREEKPIGTIEVKGEAVQFFSENEGLEKYIDASFKLSVSELESLRLKDFENEQWKIVFDEPDKHLLLQYKAEQYFKEVVTAGAEEYTLEHFCKDHESKIKVRDVVKETKERLEEFGDSALKVKGEKEIRVNPEPVSLPLPLTKKQVQDILEIIKESAPHREARELQDIVRYISSIERQLKEVSEQLNFAKAQLTSLGSKNLEVGKLLDDTEVLKKHTFSLQEKLREIKQDFSSMLKNISESIKQTGQSGLNKLIEGLKIEEKLESFQSGLSKLTADVAEKQIKMERIGFELGQAGAHLQNIDKVANGQVPLNPSPSAGNTLGNNLASPFRKIKDALSNLNETTGKVLGKVKNLKNQEEQNQKRKVAKKEEKSNKKNQQKEKRKKAIQKRRMMTLER